MTGDERRWVQSLFERTDTPATGSRPGFLGLRWTGRQDRLSHRWEVVGGPPDKPDVDLAIISPRLLPFGTNQHEAALVLAQLLNDFDEDALSLMAGDLLRAHEGNPDDGYPEVDRA